MEGQIYHITCNYSPAISGITEVVYQLSHYLARQGQDTTILAAGPVNNPVAPGVNLREFPLTPWGALWRYPQGLGEYLQDLGSGAVLHLHAPWRAPQWLAAREAHRRRIPALLTLHGLLEPYYWEVSRLRWLRNTAYWWTVAHPAFKHLPVIHAITPLERDHLMPLFPGQNFEVIPNAIDTAAADQAMSQADAASASLPDSPYLLFLGIIHPKKGIHLLLEAFARARKGRDFQMLIVGPERIPAYTAQLQAQISHLGLESWVKFMGPIYGAQKWQLFRQARAFCAPSYSEVVGLVNLEAATAAIPVITTHETGLFDFETGGGILVHPRVEELTAAVDQVLSMSDEESRDRGQQLRQLVQQRYSWDAVGPRWLELYARLLANA